MRVRQRLSRNEPHRDETRGSLRRCSADECDTPSEKYTNTTNTTTNKETNVYIQRHYTKYAYVDILRHNKRYTNVLILSNYKKYPNVYILRHYKKSILMSIC